MNSRSLRPTDRQTDASAATVVVPHSSEVDPDADVLVGGSLAVAAVNLLLLLLSVWIVSSFIF